MSINLETITAGQLSCTHKNGIIHELKVNGMLFNGFPGALELSSGLEADVTWSADGDCLICSINVTRTAGTAGDESVIAYRFPYAQAQASLTAWSARDGFPKSLYDVGGTNLIYGDICYGTALPMVSLYNPKEGIGITVAKAPGRIGGRLSFRFDDYHQEGMSVVFSAMSVAPGTTRTFQILLFGHGGCWRPGLKQYIDRYPEYFYPVNEETWNCKSFIMTTPFFTEDACRVFPSDWAEIHNHFPYYGNYLPEEKSWRSVIGDDYPKDAAGRDITLSRDQIRKHIRDLHAAGTKAMYYVQCGGDGNDEWAAKTFPESIARDSGGHLYPTWNLSSFINGDPETPFGKYLQDQLDKIIETFPELDGYFVDQLCYQAFDFEHPDGKSARLGREVGEYGVTLEKQFRRFEEKVHKLGKLILANGPFDIEAARGTDGIMSEGANSLFRTTKYMCVRRPMLMHTFLHTEFEVEAMLRSAVLTAAGWSWGGTPACARPPEATPEMKEIFRRYLPLVETMFGSEVVLEEDPVACKPAPRAEADLFRSRKNGHLLAAIVESGGYLSSGVTLRITPREPISSAKYRSINEEEWRTIEFTRDGENLIFQMPEHFGTAVIELLP